MVRSIRGLRGGYRRGQWRLDVAVAVVRVVAAGDHEARAVGAAQCLVAAAPDRVHRVREEELLVVTPVGTASSFRIHGCAKLNYMGEVFEGREVGLVRW